MGDDWREEEGTDWHVTKQTRHADGSKTRWWAKPHGDGWVLVLTTIRPGRPIASKTHASGLASLDEAKKAAAALGACPDGR